MSNVRDEGSRRLQVAIGFRQSKPIELRIATAAAVAQYEYDHHRQFCTWNETRRTVLR